MASFIFAKKDDEILKKVKQYQEDNNIDKFSEAIRQLLKYALNVKELNKNSN